MNNNIPIISKLTRAVCSALALWMISPSPARGKTSVMGNNETSGLQNIALVKKYYEWNNGRTMWFGTSGMGEAFIDILNGADTLGLEKNKYHYPELTFSLANKVTDSTNILNLDKIFTDALISFCKDIYEGERTSRMVSFDEISEKHHASDDNHILLLVETITTPAELHKAISSLEPTDNQYLVLRTELLHQIAAGNAAKVKELKIALNVYRWIHHFNFRKYIVINTASATLRYYENSVQQLFSKLIVGKPSTKTPRFSAYCNAVVFYPYWNVPQSIAVKELLPQFKRHPAAIDAMNMQVVDKSGHVIDHYAINWAKYNRSNFPYNFRQSTGCDNSLGVIKFNITDPFDVYLHDTNARKLFASDRRYYSHGCMRIQQAIELGNFLLPKKIDDAYLNACLKNQKPETVTLDEPVPVFVVYVTAEAGDQGDVVYYNDVYHLFK